VAGGYYLYEVTINLIMGNPYEPHQYKGVRIKQKIVMEKDISPMKHGELQLLGNPMEK